MKTDTRQSVGLIILVCGFFGLICTSAGAQQSQTNSAPIMTIATGWTYLYADQGGGERTNLNGWFLKPSVNIGNGYAIFADFTNYYGANRKGSINSHGYTFGVSKDVLTRPKFKSTVFAEAGDVRASNAGSIVNQFAFASGLNFAFPLRSWISLTVTPAEWVFLCPKGQPRNDFNAKVGFSFPIGRKKD